MPLILLGNPFEAGKTLQHLDRSIRGTPIDHQMLPIPIILLEHASNGFSNRALAIKAGSDDRDSRQISHSAIVPISRGYVERELSS